MGRVLGRLPKVGGSTYILLWRRNDDRAVIFVSAEEHRAVDTCNRFKYIGAFGEQDRWIGGMGSLGEGARKAPQAHR